MKPKLDVRVRPATPADWLVIAALLEANGLPLDGAQAHLETFWLAAAEDGEVLGVSGLEVYGKVGLLRSVAVRPTHHGQGVGTLLVAHALRAAADLELASVHLLTLNARDYFARLGFQLMQIDDAPQALKASAEFQGACPSSALFLSLDMASLRKEGELDIPAMGNKVRV